MIISNTMRFGAERLGSIGLQTPRLKAYVGGKITTVKTTTFKISSPSLVLRIQGEKYYVRLVSPTDTNITPLRVKINGTVYAIADTA